MRQLNAVEQIDTDAAVSSLTTIIYNQYQMPVVCDIVEYPLNLEDNFKLITKNNTNVESKNEQISVQVYISIKICQTPTKIEEQSIQRLIGLSDHLICIDLNQQLQSMIEKHYIDIIPQIYAKYSMGKNWIKKPSISFINQSYRKIYSRAAQSIYYYRTADQYLKTLPSYELTKRNRQSMISIRQDFNRSPIIMRRKQQQRKQVVHNITISELLNLYSDQSLTQKQAAQIKYSIISFQQSLFDQKKKEKAQMYIFTQGINDVNKSAIRQLQKYNFGRKDVLKLKWKYERLKNFEQLLYEQKLNKQLAVKYKKCSIFDLTQDTIILQVKQFYRHWIRNTLKQLKTAFNSIANRRDTKAINQFRSLCAKTLSVVDNSLLHCQTNVTNYSLLQKMKQQIQQFINAHENVIRDEYLSSAKYFQYQLKYMWSNQNKIYHKIGLIVMMLLLAYLQNNMFISIGLVVFGFILSIINI